MVTYYGKRVTGLVGIVASIPYTIGYAALANAKGFGVTYARLINAMGDLTEPDVIEVQAAMDYHLKQHTDDNLEFSLNGAKSQSAYPLASFSYMIINTTTHPSVSCCEMMELVGFANYFLFDLRTEVVTKYHLVPLSEAVAEKVKSTILRHVTCRGRNVYELYLSSLIEAVPFLDAWWQVVVIGVSFFTLFCLVALFIFFRFRQKHRLAQEKLWMLDGWEFRMVEDQDADINRSPSEMSQQTENDSQASSQAYSTPTVPMHLKYPYKRAKHDIFGEVTLSSVPLSSPRHWKSTAKLQMADIRQNLVHPNLLRLLGATEVSPVARVCHTSSD